MKSHASSISSVHWVRFNFVGTMGLGVQLGMLALLTTVLRMEYMPATILAVESSVLHNFVWHERFTWADRSSRRWRDACARALHFNLTTGAVSVGGNLLLMRLLVGGKHLPALLANLLAIAACSVVNFLVSDRWVFRARPGSVRSADGRNNASHLIFSKDEKLSSCEALSLPASRGSP